MTTTRKFDFITGVETSEAPVATDPVGPQDPTTLGFTDRKYTQGSASVADLTALRALDVTDRTDGDFILVRSNGIGYRYDSAETASDDALYYIEPAVGAGRYVRVSIVDPATGNAAIPGNITVEGTANITGDVTIDGDATINGTLTTINSTELNVVDANVTVNKGGVQSTANTNVAGITVEMSDATDSRLGYDSSLMSRFKAGEVGSESEIMTTGSVQTVTGEKSFTGAVSVDDAITFDELGSTPANPAPGKRKIYPKSTGFVQLDSAGIESEFGGGGGSGSGEINMIIDSSQASGWVASGAGITVATTTVAAELPLEGVIATGIKITGVSGTDYVRYRFQMSDAIKNRLLAVKFHMKDLGITAGDFDIKLFTNTTSDYLGTYDEVLLSSSEVVNADYQFYSTFGSDNSDYYELRVGRVSGTSSVVLSNVICGPGLAPASGAVVTDTVPFVATYDNPPSFSTEQTYVTRVGAHAHINFMLYSSGIGPSGTFAIDLSNIGTIDGDRQANAGANTGYVGAVQYWDGAARHGGQAFAVNANVTNNNKIIFDIDTLGVLNSNTFGNTEWLEGNIVVPIAEWAGSGTVDLGQNGTEYASNTSSSVTDDFTSFAYGVSGSPTPSGSATTRFRKRVKFQTPIQSNESIRLEFSKDGGPWASAPDGNSALCSYQLQNGQSYGVAVDVKSINATDVDVSFGRYIYTSGTTYGAAGAPWSNITNTRWRLVKSKSGQAVGFGIADSKNFGLFKGSSVQGVTTGTPIGSGVIGEEIIDTESAGLGNTANVEMNIAQIDVTPGVWDISCTLSHTGGSGSNIHIAINDSSANSAGTLFGKEKIIVAYNSGTGVGAGSIAPFRINVTSTTTYYLVSRADAVGNTYGSIRAVRMG